jgi:hypothetical protein
MHAIDYIQVVIAFCTYPTLPVCGAALEFGPTQTFFLGMHSATFWCKQFCDALDAKFLVYTTYLLPLNSRRFAENFVYFLYSAEV